MQPSTTITFDQITKRVQVRSIKPRGVDMLRAKIERLGYLPERPLLVTSDGNGGYKLIDGNHRLEAAMALGITRLPIHVVTEELDDSAIKRRARQANEASETVVPTTFVDDAELIWRESDSGKTQTVVADIMGWSRDKVAKYTALQQIKPIAWAIIVTTFEGHGTKIEEGDVTSDVTNGTFTEGLLRSILDLRAPQQVELVAKLATEKEFTKSKFKSLAEAYYARNAAKRYVMKALGDLDHSWWKDAFKEINKGAYDQDWKNEAHPKLNKLIAAIREEWEQKIGVQIIHGDFNDEIRKIADNSIDLILTDPPYGISEYQGVTKVGNQLVTANFDKDDEWDTVNPEEFYERLESWVMQWARVLRPGGALVTFCDKALVSDLWNLCKQQGLKPKNTIVWVKTNPTTAGLARKNLKSATEFMVWAIKPGAEYTFNEADGWDRSNVILAPLCGGYERLKDAKGETLHPTQKPEPVLRPLIEAFSNRGELILDGFAGVGSTGKVAKDGGRKFIGIEMNPSYVEAMQRRLA